VSIYTFLVGLGASLGLWRVLQRVPRWQAVRWLNAALVTLVCCLLGARLVFVAFNWSYYSRHVLEAFLIWKGGLAWPGAVGGGLLGILLAAHLGGLPLAMLADNLAPLAAPLAIAAWLGCWQAGCAYGDQIPTGAWWGLPTRDESGLVSMRIPVQPLAALTLVVFFWWLEMRAFPREYPGRFASLAWFGLSLNLLFFSFLRADPIPLWSGLRPDVWAAILLFLLSLGAILFTFRARWTLPWLNHPRLTHFFKRR
jgi:phosphatidylglycerol---prolipoprotein diacylglyceryl transferase